MICSVMATTGQAASAAPAGANDIVDWVTTNVGSGEAGAAGIDFDSAGNAYVVGYYEGTITIGSTTMTATDLNDIFLIKLDTNGSVVWAKSADGPDEDFALIADVQGNGNLYVSGRFSATATFGSTTLTSNGGSDVFVAKYDTNGTALWARSVGGSASDFGSASIDGAGNTYLSGAFENTMTVGSTTLTSNGGRDLFIAKYDPAGTLLWASSAGSPTNDFSGASSADAVGNVYLAGGFSGTITIGSNSLSTSATRDAFVAKLDPAGNVTWALTLGATGEADAIQLTTDGSAVYVVGAFTDTLATGPNNLVSNGDYDSFIAKIDSSGSVAWAASIGNAALELNRAIDVDSTGNVYTATTFINTIDLGSTTLDAGTATNGYLVKYDANGVLVAATSIAGAGQAAPFNLAVDPSDNVVVVGSLDGTASFGSTPVTSTSTGTLFAAKYSQIKAPVAMCQGLPVTINMQAGAAGTGTGGADVILGTAGDDVINAGAGNDTICGEGGDDRIFGDDGNDTIFGGNGKDFLFGGAGNDTMTGNGGNDRIRGQQGVDVINGNAGNDFLYGGIDGDTINGGSGNDVMGGFGGADTIIGGAGNDTIFGGFGPDIITAGDGNDRVLGLAGDDNISGDAGDDDLSGDKGQDIISGGDGNDVIKGGNSIDTLFGNGGNDDVKGGKGDDALSGGAGTDTCTGNQESIADTHDGTCETVFGVP